MEKKESEISSEKAKAHDIVSKSKEMKVCFLGDSGVGKTSIIYRYTKHSFIDRLRETVGGSGEMVEIPYLSQRFKYWLWDLGGQESFRTIVPNYFRGASVFILVYDCTEETSFGSIRQWHDLTQKYADSMKNSDDLIFILVGNKTDKRSEIVINSEAGKDLAKQLKCSFHETSALTGEGVVTLFDKMCQKTLDIERRKEAEAARNETPPDNGRQTPEHAFNLTDQHRPQQPANTKSRCRC